MTRCARAAGREMICCRASWPASQVVQAAGDRVPFLACILALSVFVYTTPGITLCGSLGSKHQLKLINFVYTHEQCAQWKNSFFVGFFLFLVLASFSFKVSEVLINTCITTVYS